MLYKHFLKISLQKLTKFNETFNNLSSTVSFNELSNNLKKEVRKLKKTNQLNQEAADDIIRMHRSELAAKVSKKVNAPEKGLHELESKAERKAKEARMEAEGAFESVQLPEDIQLSTFQKQFGEDKTVGQALRRLLKQKKSKNAACDTLFCLNDNMGLKPKNAVNPTNLSRY